MPEPQGDFTINQAGESRTLSIKSSGHIPVRLSEDADTKSDGEDGAIADRMAPLFTGKGNGHRRI